MRAGIGQAQLVRQVAHPHGAWPGRAHRVDDRDPRSPGTEDGDRILTTLPHPERQPGVRGVGVTNDFVEGPIDGNPIQPDLLEDTDQLLGRWLVCPDVSAAQGGIEDLGRRLHVVCGEHPSDQGAPGGGIERCGARGWVGMRHWL
jgi:hypothetical protein